MALFLPASLPLSWQLQPAFTLNEKDLVTSQKLKKHQSAPRASIGQSLAWYGPAIVRN